MTRRPWPLTALPICLLLAAAAQAQPLPRPVLSLDFDEGQGTTCAAAAAGADATGSVVGRIVPGQFGPMWAEGVRGTSLWFWAEPEQGVTVASRPDLDLRSQLTVTAWVWPRRFGEFQTIVWKGDRRAAVQKVNYRIALRPEGTLEFSFKGPAGEWYQMAASQPLPAQKWSYVAVIYDRGTVRLFLDGRQIAGGRMNLLKPQGVKALAWRGDQMLPNDSPWEVGRGQEPNGEPGHCFCGAIDEVRMWSAALVAPPPMPPAPDRPLLKSLVLWERELTAAQLREKPCLVGRVEGKPAPWILDVEFPDGKNRGTRLLGQAGPDGRFRYLLDEFCGPIELRGAPRMIVRAYRKSAGDRIALRDTALLAGQPQARVVVRPEKALQRIRGFGSYADVPSTFLEDPAKRDAEYAPLLAELKEVGLTHLDFSTPAQCLEPENDDADPLHINWDYFRKHFRTNAQIQTLVKYLRYLQTEGFSVGLRVIDYARWQWIPRPGTRTPQSDEVAEYCVALLKLMGEEGIRPAHLVPIWEPSYAPEVVADICAKTARLARKHGIGIPIVGPYSYATGGQSAQPDAMPDHYLVGKRYVEAYLKTAGDVCDVIGVEDYASGCALIEPNLKRLWREVIDPCTASGRPKELWMIEYGTPCGTGPWNFYPSRWHGTYGTYESAFRLARCLHQQFNGGVSNFMFWKAYDVVGDGKLISCCGLIKSSLHDYERRPPFYIARMFWKHVPRGARHVQCSAEADLLANAFFKDRRFTVVLTNPRSDTVKTDVRIDGVELAPAARLYTSTAQVQYQEREVKTDGPSVPALLLPPRSVSTIVCRAAHIGQPFDRTIWQQPAPDTVYLSDLPWAAASVAGRKSLAQLDLSGMYIDVAQDENALHEWIVVGRTRYRKGLGVKLPAEVVYDLDAKYATLEATLGIDDATGKATAAAKFEVLLDGKRVFASGPITLGQKPQQLSIACQGARQLRLIVTDAGKNSPNAMAAWADAKLRISK